MHIVSAKLSYLYTMTLSFKELKKREVINIADGKSLGHICDLTLKFPSGTLAGISVPGKKTCGLFKIFDKCEMFIEERKILKIGSDVILVNLKCSDVCADSTSVNVNEKVKPCPPPNPCAPNPCPPKLPTCEDLFGPIKKVDNRIDTEDYMWN